MRLEYEMELAMLSAEGEFGAGEPTVHASNGHGASRSQTRRGPQFLCHCGWHGGSSWQTMPRPVSSR